MNETIKPTEFTAAMNGIFDEITRDTREALSYAVREAAKDARKELKGAGDFNGTEFKGSWKMRTVTQRLGNTEATVYNQKTGLTHLLEFGHGNADGGRTRGFGFVAPVNNQVEENVIRHVQEKL